jgi:hypothetical protein
MLLPVKVPLGIARVSPVGLLARIRKASLNVSVTPQSPALASSTRDNKKNERRPATLNTRLLSLFRTADLLPTVPVPFHDSVE